MVVTNQWTKEQLGDFYESVATAAETSTPEIVAYRDGAIEH